MLSAAGAQASGWDHQPWVDDLRAMRAAFEEKYANLDWLRDEREVPVDRAFEQTEAVLRSASSDADARRVLDRFVQRIGDGHVGLSWPKPDAGSPPSAPAAYATPAALCAGLGYKGGWRSGTAAALSGFAPLAEPGPYAAGTVRVGEDVAGVLRIPAFMPQAFPEQCAAAVAAVPKVLGRPCDERCADSVLTETYRLLTRELEATYARLRAAGATVLLVDLTDNGGGSDWVETVARTISPRPLRSARVGYLRGEHWTKQWRELASRLRGFAATECGDNRRKLIAWAAEAEAHAAEAARPIGPGIPRVVPGAYTTGLVGDAKAGAFGDKPWGPHVFNPAQFPYRDGAWSGPVIVLVNDETWSAAEQFASVLRDNDVAVVIGARTGGSGCGHTGGGTPTILPNSRAVLSLPDCVRYRADGSNEVGGVIPDVMTGVGATDGPKRAAALTGAKLPEAIRAARELHQRR